LGLLPRLIQAVRGFRARSFERDTRDPRAAQQRKLLEILKRNAGTEIGRAFGFDRIRTLDDYRSAVPLRSYADHEPLIRRTMAGERNLLTADAPIFYSQSGGTTGAPKVTLVTPSYRAEYMDTVHLFAYHLQRQFPRLIDGRIVYFVGAALETAPDGVPMGSLSGFNYTAVPKVFQKKYALPPEVARIEDLTERYRTVLRLAAPLDVTWVVSITPASLRMLGETLDAWGEGLIRDVRDAGHASEAARLDAVFQERGRLRATDLWPNLQLYTCWHAAAAGSYLRGLDRWFGDTPHHDAIYAASEGWFNIPYDRDVLGGALALRSHVFEFREEDTDGPWRWCDELEAGTNYEIALTASCGLYRYAIGDVVRVTDHVERTPVLHFSHKAGLAWSFVGENMKEVHVTQAMARAIEQTGAPAGFTLVPDGSVQPARYRLILEGAPDGLASAFDAALRAENWGYDRHLQDGFLAPLITETAPLGTFRRWWQERIDAGGQDAQIKPLHLCPDADRAPTWE